MSVYADYQKVSEHYDDGRRPAGADVIAGLITVKLGKPLKDLHVLDIGCGTGNYSVALLQHGVGKVTLADANRGMLKKAKEKLELGNHLHTVVDIREAVLPSLPFQDQTYDAIMMNQVLHHLESDPDGNHFPTTQKTFKEFNRVLKPDGVLIMTNTMKHQLYGVWFYSILPTVLDRFSRRVPSNDDIIEILRNSDFDVETPMSYLGHDWFNDYYNLEGPLNESWRMGHSFFSYASEEERRNGIESMKSMKENGSLKCFCEEHDGASSIGTFTFFVLHHLELDPDGEHFPTIQETFSAIHRVLKPGGVLAITNTCKDQFYGVWFCNIMPSVLERLIKRVPSKDDIIDMMHESNFDVETPLSYLRNNWLKDYSNIEGPLLESWRMRDSFFSQAPEEEIRIGIEIVKTMKSNGTLKSFFEEHDRTSSFGTFTFFVALKK
ncbi:hypothetical protein FSP39_017873 [Pinctada imbricata]|uniref:Methyltransferase type 11 domain-containing protein n=1 Tax=Pinctada imbricata TaxID=66713 RepID=A0AA89BKX4_PINIB|nr:hypothetical protein FSP39_017873 [Pinctada imbricata]